MKFLKHLAIDSERGRFLWKENPTGTPEVAAAQERAAAEAELHAETRERLSVVKTEVEYLKFVDEQADQNLQTFSSKLEKWGKNPTAAQITSLSEHSILLATNVGENEVWKKAQARGKAMEVYNLYRTEAVARMHDAMVAKLENGTLTEEVASKIYERMMARYKNEANPKQALWQGSRMMKQDFEELNINKIEREALAEKMATKGVDVSPKNGKFVIDGKAWKITEFEGLVGGGMQAADVRMLSASVFKNVTGATPEVVIEETLPDGTVKKTYGKLFVGQQKNGCESNLVAFRATRVEGIVVPEPGPEDPDCGGDCEDRFTVGGEGETSKEKFEAVAAGKKETDEAWGKVDTMVKEFFIGEEGKAMIKGFQKALDGRTFEGGVVGLVEAVFRNKDMKNFWKKYNLEPEAFKNAVKNQLESYKLDGIQPELDQAVEGEVAAIDQQISEMGEKEWLEMAKNQPQLREWAKIVQSGKWHQVKQNLVSDITTMAISTALTGVPDIVITDIKLPFVKAVVAMPGVDAVMRAHGMGSYTEALSKAVNNQEALNEADRNAMLTDVEGYDGRKSPEEYVAEKNKNLLQRSEELEQEIDAMEARIARHEEANVGQAKLLKKTSFGLFEGKRAEMREAIKNLKKDPSDPIAIKKIAALSKIVDEGLREMREDFDDVKCDWGDSGFEKEWKMPTKLTFGPDKKDVTVIAKYVQGNWQTRVHATVSGQQVDWEITPQNVENLREGVADQYAIKRAYNRAMREIRKFQSRSSALEAVHALSRQAQTMIDLHEKQEMIHSVMEQKGTETTLDFESDGKVTSRAEQNESGEWMITFTKKGGKTETIAADASPEDVKKLPHWAEKAFVETKSALDAEIEARKNETPETAQENVDSSAAWAMLKQFDSFDQFKNSGNGWRAELFGSMVALEPVRQYYAQRNSAETNAERLAAFDALWKNPNFVSAMETYKLCAILVDCPEYKQVDWKKLKDKQGEEVLFTVDTVVGAKHARMPITTNMLWEVKKLFDPPKVEYVPTQIEVAKTPQNPEAFVNGIVDQLNAGTLTPEAKQAYLSVLQQHYGMSFLENLNQLRDLSFSHLETGEWLITKGGLVEHVTEKAASELWKVLTAMGSGTALNSITHRYSAPPENLRKAIKNAEAEAEVEK